MKVGWAPGNLGPLPPIVKSSISVFERNCQAVQEGIVGEGVPGGLARVLDRDPMGALDASGRIRRLHRTGVYRGPPAP